MRLQHIFAQNLSHLAECLHPLGPDIEIELLIGRHTAEAGRVEQQIVGPRNAPFAQKLLLGLVIGGEVCLGQSHQPPCIGALKTLLAKGPRITILNPCDKKIDTKESDFQVFDCAEHNVSKTTSEDEILRLSRDDRDLLETVDTGMKKDSE